MKEYILCAAIWYKKQPKPAIYTCINTPVGIVLCGHRHTSIIHQHVALLNKSAFEMGEYEQGFLTSNNRFVDRKEAADIHIVNGGKLNYSSIELYSEDLY